MKRILLSLIIFCFIKTSFADEQLNKQLADFIAANPNQVCADLILKALNISYGFGTFGKIASNNIFARLCFIDPKLEDLKDGSTQISGTTSFKNSPAIMKFLKKNGNINFAIGVQIGDQFKLTDLSDSFAPIDSVLKFSDVTLTISNADNFPGLFGTETLSSGLNISGKAIPQGFVKNVTDALGLNLIDFTIKAPQDFKSYKDIKFKLNPNIAAEGLCPGKALTALVNELNLSFAQDVVNKLNTSCFSAGSIMGITLDGDGNPILYFSGKIVNQDLGMIKIKKDKTGKIIYTVGYKLFGAFGFSNVNKSLSNLDSIVKISGPALIYSNADKDTIFDLNTDTNNLDPNIGTALPVTAGFSLYGRADFQGSINEIMAPLALSKTRILLTLPKGAKSIKDVKIKILPFLGTKICPFKALHMTLIKLGINLDTFAELADFLNEICVGTESGLVEQEDGTLISYVQGTPEKYGGNLMLKYQLPENKSAENPQGLSIGYKPAIDFKFKNISSKLSFLDNFITKLDEVTISLATTDNLSIFDVDTQKSQIDPNIKGSVSKLVKGITISANAKFGTALGEALKIAAAQTVQVKIFLPSAAKGPGDIRIGVLTAAGTEEQKLCLNNVFGQIFSGSLSTLGNTCITGKHFELMPDIEKQTVEIVYDGTITLFGKSNIDAKLYVDIAAGDRTAALFAQINGDIGLSSIASEFKPFELYTLKNPKIVIANKDSSELDLLGTGQIKKGFTILSEITWRPEIAKLMDSIGMSGALTVLINVPLDPKNLSQFSFAIDKEINQSIAKVVTFKKVHLEFQGSEKPTIGLAIDALFKMPGSTNKTKTGEDGIAIILGGSANAVGTVTLEVDIKRSGDLPLIDKPFGLPLKLTNPWVKVGLTQGVLTEVGVAGKIEIGKSKADVTSDINIVEPESSGLIGKDIKIDLLDLYLFFKNFVPKLQDLQLPNILTMKIDEISINPTPRDLKIRDKTIPPGVKLQGNVDIPVIKSSGTIDINIDLKSLTLSGNANLTPIDLGGVIKLVSSNDPSKGPTLGIALDFQQQRMWIDGYANLAGILESKTKLNLDKTGLSLDMASLFAGMGSKVHASIPLPNYQDANVSYTITDENLINFIRTDLTSTVNNINKQANDLKNSIQNSVNGLKNQCGNIVGISDICQGSLDAVNQSLTLFNAVFETLTKKTGETIAGITSKATTVLQFNHITVAGNLAAVKQGKLLSVEVDFNLFGKNYVKTLNISVPKDIAAFGSAISKEIFNIIAPLISPILDQLKSLASTIQAFIDGSIKLIGSSLEIAKSAGALIYQAGKMVFTMSPESAKEFVNAINNYGNAISNFGKDLGGAIISVATQVGKSIVSIASSVGNTIEETWHSILRGGSLEYNYSIINNWKSPVDISIWSFAGNLKTAVCQVFANVAPGATVSWKSKTCMPNGIYWTDKNNNGNKVFFSNGGMQFDWSWQISSNGKITIPANWSPNCVRH